MESWDLKYIEMNKFAGSKDGYYEDISSTLREHAQKSMKKIKLRQYSQCVPSASLAAR